MYLRLNPSRQPPTTAPSTDLFELVSPNKTYIPMAHSAGNFHTVPSSAPKADSVCFHRRNPQLLPRLGSSILFGFLFPALVLLFVTQKIGLSELALVSFFLA
jgi:hypothetical protein